MASVLQLQSEKQIVVLKLEILEAYSMNNLGSVFKLIRLASQSELPLRKVVNICIIMCGWPGIELPGEGKEVAWNSASWKRRGANLE